MRKYEATGGELGHDWNGTSCLILHTLGRKTGATRKFPLIYGRDGSDYVVIASKGGAPEHPQWFRNLVFTKNRNHRIITYSRAKKDIKLSRGSSFAPCSVVEA